jgi:(2R)-sulfolactate sulfo-lyase subunit beta
MDSSSAAAEFITLMGAAGAALHLFPTGQGNIIGNPIVPVLKITANPLTARTMALINRTINGRLTCAEALGHREFVLTKLYRSA